MRIASWSWGGRPQVGTISPCGREATPLAVADAARGALPLIEARARGEPLPLRWLGAGDVVKVEIDGIGAIENVFQ